jgi:PAS domain S-box-containing protein
MHKILIVDDHVDNRYLAEALLTGNGHQVQAVANGVEALAQLQSREFDLIISDILMPVMDGFELCRKVKMDKKLCQIPFIVYTATYTGPQDEALALKIGADRFLQKPCEPDLFMAVIEEVMAAPKSGDSLPKVDPLQEEEVFKLYNERLVRKLEQKMVQLENETKALRETEEALRASEKKYRRLYESMTDGFAYVDMQGNIRESNEAFQQMLGYRGEELARLTYNELTPENWHAYEQEIVQNQILKKGFSEVYEKEYRKKDGSTFPVELRTFLICNDVGEKEGMWAIIRDLTARREAEKFQQGLEDQLHQAQKMESVGRLAGGVAHDFNNMLSVILSYAEMGLGKTAPGSALHGYFEDILDAAQRSAGITRQLLAFARKQAVVPQVLNLNETVESMLKMLRRLIGEDITLTWLPQPDLWPVKIDPSQIDQLLANLCVNCRDAIIGVGKITIETGMVILDATYCASHIGAVPGEYVLLAVSDNGCGMGKETLDKIFEPFFTSKELGEGTGLGLATVYGIVKQNNGSIRVYSEPGKGATFKIYLPRHSQHLAKVEQESSGAIQRGQGESVLVVEDEPVILEMTGIILSDLGYKVLSAGSPKEAVRLAENQTTEIHLLLTDVIMPDMNGKDLADLLLITHPNLKCLFMSGYTANVIASHGVLDKEINFIQKPFSVRDLSIKVRETLDQRPPANGAE